MRPRASKSSCTALEYQRTEPRCGKRRAGTLAAMASTTSAHVSPSPSVGRASRIAARIISYFSSSRVKLACLVLMFLARICLLLLTPCSGLLTLLGPHPFLVLLVLYHLDGGRIGVNFTSLEGFPGLGRQVLIAGAYLVNVCPTLYPLVRL